MSWFPITLSEYAKSPSAEIGDGVSNADLAETGLR
jgi:hypothetical protein